MNNKQIQKLEYLLAKRKQKIESLNNFDAYFEKFSYSILKRVTIEINNKLEIINTEGLRIFNEHPYENRRTRYFVMLQLLPGSYRRSNFFLDNTTSFPSLIFEGDEFTGKVKSTISFDSKLSMTSEYEIVKLTEDEFVSEIVINFLDTIYSL